MLHHTIDDDGLTLNLGSPRNAAGPADPGIYKVGETTGMFRARTAAGIEVEMEKEVDIDQLPANLRKFLLNHSTR